jgi:hypothetical protein
MENIKTFQKPCTWRRKNMYQKPSPQTTIDDFILPFAGKLNAENRWVKLAQIIPWDEKEIWARPDFNKAQRDI